MAARSRITVLLLLFLLSTEHSFAVNLNQLTPLVKELLRAYRVNGMFSLAVSIPQNQNQNQNAHQIIQEVLRSDPANNVQNNINNGGEYLGSRVVAAKPGANMHAELRVVDRLTQLYTSPQFNPNDLLLLYVRASPCVETCTDAVHPLSILRGLNEIRRWNNYAVVFSKIFRPSNGPENTDRERVRALRRLATYESGEIESERGPVGLQNIFRCDRNENQQMQCVSCSSDGQVAQACVSDVPPFASTNTGPQTGRGASSSRGGGRGGMQTGRGASSPRGGGRGGMQSGRGGSSPQRGGRGGMQSGTGGSSSRGGDQDVWQTPKKGRGRRDISYNAGDSSAHISESNKGAEDAPPVDENGNDVATGESVPLSPAGSDEGNGGDLRTAEDGSSPQISFDSGDGEVSKGKGKVSKGKGGKGRRGKGKGRRGKGRRGKGRRGGKGKGRRGKGKGRRGKKSRRGGRSRRRGLDQDWIFASDILRSIK